jgi:hypothetical protein
MKKYILPALILSTLALGCKKDIQDYDVPTSYNFENVSYSGQSQRQDMLGEMVDYMESARVPGTTLDAQTLLNMFENQNDPFSFQSTKQLKDKCFLGDQSLITQWLNDVAAASTSNNPASAGVAGIATSLDGTERFLLGANGYDYTELIEKGIMGAVFYYQATGVYLTEDKIGDGIDNETVTAGEGTTMQHHWDEAFGYLGVAKNFPTATADARYWGKACNERNPLISSNKALMDGFLLGRAAIGGDDHDTKWTAVTTIQTQWERVVAASAIHELNEAKSHLADDALRNHEISEALGYIRALKYNPNRKISTTAIQTLLDSFGSDLYQVTIPMIDQARNTLADTFGFSTIKDQL